MSQLMYSCHMFTFELFMGDYWVKIEEEICGKIICNAVGA